jgi:hypothetical protein
MSTRERERERERESLNVSSSLRSRGKSFVFTINLLNNQNTAIRSWSRVCIEHLMWFGCSGIALYMYYCVYETSLCYIVFFVSQQSKSGPSPRSRTIKHTHTRAHARTHSEELLWTSDQHVTYTKRHKHNKHPCSQRDSNPRSQQSSGCRHIKFCYVVILYIKPWKMRWAGHVAHTGENRNVCRGKSERRKYF